MRPSSLSLTLVLALLVAPLAGQEAGGPQIARIVATPPELRLTSGDSTSISIQAFDASGSPIDVQFRMAAPRDALRVRGGRVVALAAGEYRIVVTPVVTGRPSGPLASLEIPVVVAWPEIAEVRLEGDAPALYVSTRVRLRARALHTDGTDRPSPDFAWSSSDETIATVDRFGTVTGHATGTVIVGAEIEGTRGAVTYRVAPFRGREIRFGSAPGQARTGDVISLGVTVLDESGQALQDVAIEWSHAYVPSDDVVAPGAPGQVDDGRFVADVPGVHTIIATAGPLSARHTVDIRLRDVVQSLEIVGQGTEDRVRTTDFWVFEGLDGRDYALTGSKRSDGHAFVWDVTDPSNIFKTDSIQVDARSVNDVKVAPNARYATVTREGASNRRNGVVILDLADPAHPVVAAEFTEGLTGGVHNAFPTEDYLFALSNGDKYVILDVTDLYNPRYVSEYDHPDSRVHDVWVHDGIAYSAEWGTGVVAVDVGNGRWGGSIQNPVFIMAYPVPSGGTHAVFPYVQEDTGSLYLFIGDEIMSRRGLAWEGPPSSRGSYQVPYDPETGLGGVPLATQGYIQVIDFTDPESPRMVARYEVTEYGTHNIWVEDDKLYQAYYEGGLRVVDVSGDLMGNLYTQGREIAVFKPYDPVGYIPNSPMVWSAMPHKGHVFFSDTNSGLWAVKLLPKERPVS